MKNKGFSETLKVLGKYEDHIVQSEFFNEINEISYYNAYLRMKKKMLDLGLISFKLNDKVDKMIGLTEKGKRILKKMNEIEDILTT